MSNSMQNVTETWSRLAKPQNMAFVCACQLQAIAMLITILLNRPLHMTPFWRWLKQDRKLLLNLTATLILIGIN
jgi:hypothetical protein